MIDNISPGTWINILLIGCIILAIWGIIKVDDWWAKRCRRKELEKAWEVYFGKH